jgi:polyhydroxybutyrate depolymerase
VPIQITGDKLALSFGTASDISFNLRMRSSALRNSPEIAAGIFRPTVGRLRDQKNPMRVKTYLWLAFVLLLLPASASAAGTLVKGKTTWNGISRIYAVYIPQGMPANAPMVLFLHATQDGGPTNPPWMSQPTTWEPLADSHKFLMVWPVSTYNLRSGQWYWDSDFVDFSFNSEPDDIGYLRNLITSLAAEYRTNPNRVFVSGMSAGGYMTQRVGSELADIVAAIAPVSGPIWAQPETQSQNPSLPSRPISVIEFHGTVDQNVPYCGGSHRTVWKEPGNTIASTQESINYWVAANGCSKLSTSEPVCTSNQGANPKFAGLQATNCMNGVEVQFVPELGYGHVWVPGTETIIWRFFAAHGR